MKKFLLLAASLPLSFSSVCNAAPIVRSSYPASQEQRAPDRTANESKVIGGIPARQGQFKWQVALLRSNAQDPYDGFYCGGSLIGWRWVLTAAHCTYADGPNPLARPKSLDSSDIDVYAGSVDFEGGQRIRVKNIVRHEKYDLDSQDNDIALLELETNAPEASGLALLEVADEGDHERVQPGRTATVLGWGSTESGVVPLRQRKASPELLYVPGVEFKGAEECNESHLVARRDSMKERLKQFRRPQGEIIAEIDQAYPLNAHLVTENMICAGTSGGSKDSCFGDSGGPLIVYRGDTPYQAGIVSWGPESGCGITDQFGVYVDVTKFRGWIRDKTK